MDGSPQALIELFSAIASRNTAATASNDSSSRSHCIVALTLFALEPKRDLVRVSTLKFVDLAGSERVHHQSPAAAASASASAPQPKGSTMQKLEGIATK